MKLHFSATSPYVRKCLVVAHELGVADRIGLLPSNAHPVQRDAALVAQNPLGKVPTLVSDDGLVLYDSRVICEYLDSRFGGALFPREGAARWQALTLQSLADGMLDAALLARYEEALRPEPQRWAGLARRPARQGAHLAGSARSRAAGLAGRVDIGTLALGCALGYLDLRFERLGWRGQYPQVAAWAEVFMQRPSMAAKWSL
jgi:glutathione S-transferase